LKTGSVKRMSSHAPDRDHSYQMGRELCLLLIQGAIQNTEHYDARELKMLIVHMLIRERAVELQFSDGVVVVFDHSLIDCVRE